jgi:WD40 repeat protein
LQVFDLALKKRPYKIDMTLQGPLAYSPNGLFLAAISPDCKYLACRTEASVEVSDLLTGKFLGEVTGDSACFVLAVAFTSESDFMVVGKSNGDVMLYDVAVIR